MKFITSFINQYKVTILVVLSLLLLSFFCYHSSKQKTPEASALSPATVQPKPITSTSNTTIRTVPKTHPEDNNLEMNQTYKAEINGQTVVLPTKVTAKEPTIDGSKVILEQTIDFTEVVQKMTEHEVDKRRTRISGGLGLGVHEGDWYVPLSLTRHFSPNKSLRLEIHIGTKDIGSVTGGEIVYERKLW